MIRSVITGDINANGEIYVDDLTVLRSYLLGYSDLFDDSITRLDCTEDGEVDSVDLLSLHQHLLGIRTIMRVTPRIINE